MRILQISGYGVRVRVHDGGLLIESKDDGKRMVPVSDVDLVIVHTSGVSITSNAVRMLVRAGVEIVFVDYRGHPLAMVYSSEPTLTVETKRSQYSAYFDGRGVRLAAEFVLSKMHNQRVALARIHARLRERLLVEAAERIRSVEEELSEIVEDAGSLESARRIIMGLEARAAREYWGAVSRILPVELGFEGRSRDRGDPVNTVLNYAYGVLYPIMWRALLLAGLDPYAGYLHVDRSGKPVLSFDYIECWRPVLVDYHIIQRFLSGWRPAMSDGSLEPSTRREIVAVIKENLDSTCHNAYRRMKWGEAVRGYALRLAKALRDHGEFKCYRGRAR